MWFHVHIHIFQLGNYSKKQNKTTKLHKCTLTFQAYINPIHCTKFLYYFLLTSINAGRGQDRAKSPSQTNGASVSTRVTGQRTTIDYGDTKHGRGKGGEVTVRTVTEEERTITGPTRKHYTVTKTPVSKTTPAGDKKSPRSSTVTSPRASSLSTRTGTSTTPRSTSARSTTTTKSSTPKTGWRR